MTDLSRTREAVEWYDELAPFRIEEPNRSNANITALAEAARRFIEIVATGKRVMTHDDELSGEPLLQVQEPGVYLVIPSTAGWWQCPLFQCTHGRVLHDGDGVDEPFSCCEDECDCQGHYVLAAGEPPRNTNYAGIEEEEEDQR